MPFTLRRRSLFAAPLLLAAPPLAGAARAQGNDWPNRPVRYINPYPPGGPTDTLSRIYCQKMTELTGQQFVVENRAGAGGNVGSEVLARSQPDGYTIGLGGIASHAIAPTLYPTLPFDVEKDFTLVAGIWQLPNLLAVHPSIAATTTAELIALLKANPGKYSFGSAGSGTTLHLAGEMFKHLAGVDMQHIPYRGSAPAQVDLMAGRVAMMFDNMPGTLALSREGKVRPIAVTSLARSPVAPEIPAISETLPGFDVISWTCVTGPAGLPRAMVERLAAFTKRAVQSADLVQAYFNQGAAAWDIGQEGINAYAHAQRARLAPLIRASGARVD